MNKFKCGRCAKTCTLLLDENLARPRSCIYGNRESLWFVIKEDSAENAQTTNEQFGNSEQLPDWVKVGAIGYDESDVGYYEVTAIHGGYIDILYLEEDETTGGINNSNAWNSKQARKRPFNEAEMKALVGKIVETENQIAIVIGYIKNSNRILLGNDNFLSAEQLINLEATINGKPCYKLEHLNENGEWVE